MDRNGDVTVMDKELDKLVTEIMQSGFDSAIYGSPFETDEENEKQRNYWYDTYHEQAKQQLITLISKTVNEVIDTTPGYIIDGHVHIKLTDLKDTISELLNKKEEK